MYGAILGDIIGSPYEFDRGDKSKEFPLFCELSEFTDDTVMTVAVADAIIKYKKFCKDSWKKGYYCEKLGVTPDNILRDTIADSMQQWGRKYPFAGYGSNFNCWIYNEIPLPYNSFGNGSAMRVSSVGWLFDNMFDVRRYARISAEVTHNHPEGIKGAEAVASAIFLARNGHCKNDIKQYIEKEFNYDLSHSCDEIRIDYHHVESCQETVPQAIIAFLEGIDFEDVIRTAVSLGGDCDTICCIAGSIAEAYYGISDELKAECYSRVADDMRQVLTEFSIII